MLWNASVSKDDFVEHNTVSNEFPIKKTGVSCGCFDSAFCGVCCVILHFLFAVALVLVPMLFAVASVVYSVVDYVFGSLLWLL